MSKAPERLWADGNQYWDSGSWGQSKEFDNDVEYVRADIVQALTAERDRQYDENAHRIAMQAKAEAERDRLRKELEAIANEYEAGYPLSHDAIKYAARAALKGETP